MNLIILEKLKLFNDLGKRRAKLSNNCEKKKSWWSGEKLYNFQHDDVPSYYKKQEKLAGTPLQIY